MRNVLFFVIIFIALAACRKTVWDAPKYQKMTLSVADSVMNFRITDSKGIEAKADRTYWWYYNGSIQSTVGGFSGKLLNEEFEVLGSDGVLRTKGEFKSGLMDGVWTVWDSGKLVTRSEYKSGLKNGSFSRYENGKIKESGTYDNGLKDGVFKTYDYLRDTVYSVTYKDDEEVIREISEKSENGD